MDRFSEYRIMWVLVFFDLPTETKKDKKAHVLKTVDIRSPKTGISVHYSYSLLMAMQIY